MTPEQIQEAHELFDMYDHDSSGSIDNEELMDALRLLGQSPTEEDVTALIQEVDVNENGDLTLNEFLTVYEKVVSLCLRFRACCRACCLCRLCDCTREMSLRTRWVYAR